MICYCVRAARWWSPTARVQHSDLCTPRGIGPALPPWSIGARPSRPVLLYDDGERYSVLPTLHPDVVMTTPDDYHVDCEHA